LKNLATYLVLALVLSIGAMVGLHGLEVRNLQAEGAQIETYAQRQAIASGLVLDLERYRRSAKDFRKLTDAEIDKVKDRLTNSVATGVAKLEKLEPTAEEHKLGSGVPRKLSEFMELSAKLEPTLFLKDAFIKEPARDLHESIVADLVQLQKSAASNVEKARADLVKPVPGQSRWILISAAIALAMTALLLLRAFLAYVRPIAQLRARAESLSRGPHNHTPVATDGGPDRPLTGAYGEIERILRDLSSTVDSLRKERHQFVTAIAQDLRTPLVALQAGASLLAEPTARSTDSDRRAASEVVGRSLFRLSSSLEDLNDIVEIERSDIRLDEKIVDIRGIVAETARRLTGPGASHEVRLGLPSVPVWAMIDPARFERVLVHLMAKAMSFMPQGGRIDVSMARPSRGSFRGLEIVIQDAERLAHGRGAATGPEQELLRHWVAENGFGMALVSKVVRAHGGSVTASGVAGTGVLFNLRLPQERLGTGQVTSPAGGELSTPISPIALESPRVQTMFSKETVHFGS
jgi:signal transduction histidine kinase